MPPASRASVLLLLLAVLAVGPAAVFIRLADAPPISVPSASQWSRTRAMARFSAARVSLASQSRQVHQDCCMARAWATSSGPKGMTAQAAMAGGPVAPAVDWNQWDHADLQQAEARRGASRPPDAPPPAQR